VKDEKNKIKNLLLFVFLFFEGCWCFFYWLHGRCSLFLRV